MRNHNITYALVEKVKLKDPKAFEYIYEHYSPALNGIITRIVQDDNMSKEVLQDTFLKIWQQIEKFDKSKGAFFTWIYQIARNLALDKLKSRDFKSSAKSFDIDHFVSIEDRTNNNSDYVGIREIIKSLGESCNELIHQNFFLGFSHKEISENKNMALGTVKTRIRKCLLDLRKILKSEFE